MLREGNEQGQNHPFPISQDGVRASRWHHWHAGQYVPRRFKKTDLKEANGDSAAAYVIEEQWARDVEHV